MISPHHRFLHGLELHSSDLRQVWVIEGAGVTDTFFHDTFHGCVDLRATLQLWAHDSARPGADVITAVLTRDARLDFSVNTDPADAERRFYGSSRRPRRYGNGVESAPANTATENDEAIQAASLEAAGRVAAGLGSSQGLLNLMLHVKAAFQRGNSDLMVVIDDLPLVLRGMHYRGELGAAHEIIVATQDLVKVVKTGRPGRVLVLLDRDGRLLEEEVLPKGEDLRQTTLQPPTESEIAAALGRAARRGGFSLTHPAAVGKVLAAEGSLNLALAVAARAHVRDRAVSLESVLDLPAANDADVAKTLAELNALVGLDGPDGVKARVANLLQTARVRRRDLLQQGSIPDSSLHLVFEGNPGTGKTTVARIIGRLFHALGLLARPTVVEGTVSGIVAPEIGRTRQNMQTLLTTSRGGVLFIDEAHQLANDNGREALESLVPFAENHRADTVIILAGYRDDVRRLMEVDPGLPSRFNHVLSFEDYSEKDLWHILISSLESQGWVLAADAEPRLRALLRVRKGRPGFGNARGVRNLRDELIQQHLEREAIDRIISVDDLPTSARPHPQDLAEAQARLDQLVGLDDFRDLLTRLRNRVTYAISHAEPLPPLAGYRFVGPPGTGKTTVARLLGQYLYGLGVLENTKFEDTTGAQLKAGYIGQTAGLVAGLFDKARGGMLFIDEAYGIAPGGQGDSFSSDAIQTLVNECTRPENAGTLVVLAGYEDEINAMLQANSGLPRRFSEVVRFSTFTPAQLLRVARQWAGNRGFQLAEEFGPLFELVAARASIATNFGNAGWAENVTRWTADVMMGRVIAGIGEDRVLTADDLRVAVGSQYPALLLPEQTPSLQAHGPSCPQPADSTPPTPWSAAKVRLPAPLELPIESDADAANVLAASTFPLTVTLRDGGQHTGTGFHITPDGLAVTAAHLLENGRSVRAHLPGLPAAVMAKLVAIDPDTDVALIQLEQEATASIHALALGRSTSLERMHHLVVAGYNQTTAEEECHTVAAAVSRNSPHLDPVYFEIDGAVEFGVSGGPVFDPQQHAVVGLVHGGRGTTVKVMVRVEQVFSLLERHGWPGQVAQVETSVLVEQE